jgi:hypothetical protein
MEVENSVGRWRRIGSRQLQGGLYSNQSQLFILDRMVEIYPKCMVLQQI